MLIESVHFAAIKTQPMKQKLSIVILAAAIFIFNNRLQAQVNKGASLLGGGINISSQKNKEVQNPYKNDFGDFGFTPSYGKAIRRNLIVGAELNYSRGTQKTLYGTTEYKRINTYYGMGAFARSYRNLGQSPFYLFLQSRVGFAIFDEKRNNSDAAIPDTKSNGLQVNLSLYPGVAYAITPKFHIETGLNDLLYVRYSNSKAKVNGASGNTQKSSSFGAGASIGGNTQFSIGFRFLWGS